MRLREMRFASVMAVTAMVLIYSADALAAGDLERGQILYATCGACHGLKAEGMSALNTPALNGLEPWYLVRQLKNFKSGIRGSNPKDTYGMQMAPMAQTLPDEQAMEDVAAYIQTLDE